jgi:hypothetical protein
MGSGTRLGHTRNSALLAWYLVVWEVSRFDGAWDSSVLTNGQQKLQSGFSDIGLQQFGLLRIQWPLSGLLMFSQDGFLTGRMAQAREDDR